MNDLLRLRWAFAGVAASALLGGCFGGGGDDAPAPPPVMPPPPDVLAAVPDSARQSVDGLISYLKSLTMHPSETREPIELNALTLPTNDGIEPTPL